LIKTQIVGVQARKSRGDFSMQKKKVAADEEKMPSSWEGRINAGVKNVEFLGGGCPDDHVSKGAAR